MKSQSRFGAGQERWLRLAQTAVAVFMMAILVAVISEPKRAVSHVLTDIELVASIVAVVAVLRYAVLHERESGPESMKRSSVLVVVAGVLVSVVFVYALVGGARSWITALAGLVWAIFVGAASYRVWRRKPHSEL